MKRIVTALLFIAVATACSETPTDAASLSGSASSARSAANESANPLDIAVIGDTPYGSAAIGLFPILVQAINADPKVREVVHIGDLKSGSEVCSDARFQVATDLFNSFKDPFIYAIGDNEWTDCHRTNNGGFNPLERLAKVRQLLYPVPGQALGKHPKSVEAQQGYPENQLWVEARVTFATLHILGSNNGLDPWFGNRKVNNVPVPETLEEAASRVAEVTARQAANLAWLEQTFAMAKARGSVGIVLFFQADLWHPEDRAGGAEFSAHQSWVARFSELAREFNGRILLIGGDSHDYRVDPGVPWMSTYYGVPSPQNVTQVIVDRTIESSPSDAAPNPPSVIEWLRLHIDPRSPDVFSWEQVVVQ